MLLLMSVKCSGSWVLYRLSTSLTYWCYVYEVPTLSKLRLELFYPSSSPFTHDPFESQVWYSVVLLKNRFPMVTGRSHTVNTVILRGQKRTDSSCGWDSALHLKPWQCFPKPLALPFPAVFAVATLPLFSASVTFPLKLGPLLQALRPTLASLPRRQT